MGIVNTEKMIIYPNTPFCFFGEFNLLPLPWAAVLYPPPGAYLLRRSAGPTGAVYASGNVPIAPLPKSPKNGLKMAYRGYNRFRLFPGAVLGLDRLALAAPGWPVPLSCSAGGSVCCPLAALWRLCSGFYGLAYILIPSHGKSPLQAITAAYRGQKENRHFWRLPLICCA